MRAGGTTLRTRGRCWAVAGCVLWVTAALACATAATDRAPAEPEPKLPSGSKLDRDLPSGTVRFLKGQNLSRDLESAPGFKASRMAGDAEGVARAFLDYFDALWRLDDPRAELRLRRVDVDRTGASHVRFEQAWQRIRIPGAELIVHLDRDRRVVLVSGAYIRTPRDVTTTPALDAAAARDAAAEATGAAPCAECAAELVIFTDGGSKTRLAWRIAPAKGVRGEDVVVDAKSGALLRRPPAP